MRGPPGRGLQRAIVQAHAAARIAVPAELEGPSAAGAQAPRAAVRVRAVADVEGVDGRSCRPRACRAVQRHMLRTHQQSPSAHPSHEQRLQCRKLLQWSSNTHAGNGVPGAQQASPRKEGAQSLQALM